MAHTEVCIPGPGIHVRIETLGIVVASTFIIAISQIRTDRWGSSWLVLSAGPKFITTTVSDGYRMTVPGIDVSPSTPVATAPRRRPLSSPPPPPWVPITIWLRRVTRLPCGRDPAKRLAPWTSRVSVITSLPLVRLRTSISVDRLMAAASSGEMSRSGRNSSMAWGIPQGGSLYYVPIQSKQRASMLSHATFRLGKRTGGVRKRLAPLSIRNVDRASYQGDISGRIQRDLFRERPVKDSGAVGPV